MEPVARHRAGLRLGHPCWRRLDEWACAGVFDQLQVVLLDELGQAGRVDLERVSVDSFSLRAVNGGPDRRKSGRSRQGRFQAAPGGERNGLPVSVVLSAANANDSTMLAAVLDDIPPIRMPTGRHRRRPGTVHADKAYDHRRLPRLPAPARDQAADRPPHDRVLPTAWPSPLDHRAHRGLAWRMATAADPLRALL
jgi:DDE family transposase